MTHAEKAAERLAHDLEYWGSDEDYKAEIDLTTAIIQQAIDDSQSQQIAELKGENKELRNYGEILLEYIDGTGSTNNLRDHINCTEDYDLDCVIRQALSQQPKTEEKHNEN